MAEVPALELRSVSVRYGQVIALEDVSIVVNSGELVCLLGGNASGKTTTMKSILGLVSVSAGHILISGTDTTRSSTSAIIRRGLAMVPENRELFPGMTVLENLQLGAYGRQGRAEIEADIEYVCTLFPRVGERLRQHAGTLSGGEQQMVAFGRALMARPTVILMDEPSMGLSPALVRQTFGAIQQIHAEGKTVLVVEQNAATSLSIADRGYVLQSGRIVLEGPAKELAADRRLREAYLGHAD